MTGRRGRAPGIKLPDEHRAKIKSALILKALEDHCLGLRKMSQTQVTAATVLLRKVLPDLSQTNVTGDPNNPVLHRVIITGVRRPGDEVPGEVRVINGLPLPTPSDH